MSFTSQRQLKGVKLPDLEKGIIATNPYDSYEVLPQTGVPDHSMWDMFVQRWRIISTSELYDNWEKWIVDVGALAILLLIVWGLISFGKNIIG